MGVDGRSGACSRVLAAGAPGGGSGHPDSPLREGVNRSSEVARPDFTQSAGLMQDLGLNELLKRECPRRLRERVQCVRLLAMGRTTVDVVGIVGVGLSTAEHHKRRFLAEGEDYLLSSPAGGRRNQILSVEAEAEVMESLRGAAERGEIVASMRIRNAVESAAGRRISPRTVYRVMDRAGWRKVVPGPTHPEADPTRREALKETFQT